MATGDPALAIRRVKGRLPVLAAAALCLGVGGCAQSFGESSGSMFAPFAGTADAAASVPQDPQKAVEHWAKEYGKDPQNLDTALAYAQSLKVIGQKSQALGVLQQASIIHGNDRRLASDYGRLALELDQVSVAKKLLEVADDPANPDWRVIMARGTALAKETKYSEAIPFYERALTLAPDHPSIMNNLALAYTMSGDAAKAESLLRRAADANGANTKVRQNLALVLGLQGKYDEAVRVGSAGLSPDSAQANTDLVRKMVKLEPKADTAGAIAANAAVESQVAAVWSAEVLEGDNGASDHAPEAATVKPASSSSALTAGAEMHTWPHLGDDADGGADALASNPAQ